MYKNGTSLPGTLICWFLSRGESATGIDPASYKSSVTESVVHWRVKSSVWFEAFRSGANSGRFFGNTNRFEGIMDCDFEEQWKGISDCSVPWLTIQGHDLCGNAGIIP